MRPQRIVGVSGAVQFAEVYVAVGAFGVFTGTPYLLDDLPFVAACQNLLVGIPAGAASENIPVRFTGGLHPHFLIVMGMGKLFENGRFQLFADVAASFSGPLRCFAGFQGGDPFGPAVRRFGDADGVVAAAGAAEDSQAFFGAGGLFCHAGGIAMGMGQPIQCFGIFRTAYAAFAGLCTEGCFRRFFGSTPIPVGMAFGCRKICGFGCFAGFAGIGCIAFFRAGRRCDLCFIVVCAAGGVAVFVAAAAEDTLMQGVTLFAASGLYNRCLVAVGRFCNGLCVLRPTGTGECLFSFPGAGRLGGHLLLVAVLVGQLGNTLGFGFLAYGAAALSCANAAFRGGSGDTPASPAMCVGC